MSNNVHFLKKGFLTLHTDIYNYLGCSRYMSNRSQGTTCKRMGLPFWLFTASTSRKKCDTTWFLGSFAVRLMFCLETRVYVGATWLREFEKAKTHNKHTRCYIRTRTQKCYCSTASVQHEARSVRLVHRFHSICGFQQSTSVLTYGNAPATK